MFVFRKISLSYRGSIRTVGVLAELSRPRHLRWRACFVYRIRSLLCPDDSRAQNHVRHEASRLRHWPLEVSNVSRQSERSGAAWSSSTFILQLILLPPADAFSASYKVVDNCAKGSPTRRMTWLPADGARSRRPPHRPSRVNVSSASFEDGVSALLQAVQAYCSHRDTWNIP
jgi:hypothetical protein